MVFTRSGNSKRGNHGSSNNSNLKNVPRFKTIKDYIIQRNVIENEEFKIWKDNWSVMFEFITTFKPLEFKPFQGDNVLEKYESETFKNVTITQSTTDENTLYINLNDDEYIYKAELDFDKINKGELDFWKLSKIGCIPNNDKLLQMELISEDRLLVLTSKQLQIYNLSKNNDFDSSELIKNLDFMNYDKINPDEFGFLQLNKDEQKDFPTPHFSIIQNDQILLDSGYLIQIEKTKLSIVKKLIFSNENLKLTPYLITNFKDQLLYTFEGNIIYSQFSSTDNEKQVVLDINKWNESIAEYEEDKVEEITSLSICEYNTNLLITGHINGEINLWDISEIPVAQKYNKILKLKHNLIQNRELLVDRTIKQKNTAYNDKLKANHFERYNYNIVENYLATKRINTLDENGVEWIYPYINKVEWINDHEFLTHCSRSGFIYHWDIVPFIKHDMKIVEAIKENKEENIERLTVDECLQECLMFKHTSGGQRRDRSPKYLEECNIKQRMLHSTGYWPKKNLFTTVTNDGTILIYKPFK